MNKSIFKIRKYNQDEAGMLLTETTFFEDPQDAYRDWEVAGQRFDEVKVFILTTAGTFTNISDELFLTECEWLGAEVDWENFYGPGENQPPVPDSAFGFLA